VNRAFGCVALLFFATFLVASTIFGVSRVRRVRRLEALAAHLPWQTSADGPVRLEGTLVLAGGPLRAWKASQRHGKWSNTLCARRPSPAPPESEPRLKVGDAQVSLRGMLAHVDWEGIGEFGEQGRAVRLFSAYPQSIAREQLPEEVPADCVAPSGITDYSLTTLASGAVIQVLGCRRGSELVPCGDGMDVVSTRSLLEVRTSLASDAVPALFASAWFSILGLTLSLLLISRLPSVPETPR
jgi:hypothetical protein